MNGNVYSNIKNPCNLDFSDLMWGDFSPQLDRNVFKGIHNDNFISKEIDEDDYIMIYSYEFDKKGYPIKIEASDNAAWSSISMVITYYE